MTGGAASQRIVPLRGTYRAVSAEASGVVAGSSTRCPSRPSSSSDSTSPGKSPARSALGRTPFWRWRWRAMRVGLQFARFVGHAVLLHRFRTLARRNWRTGLSDLRGDLRRNTFVRALQHNVSCLRCAPNMWAGRTAGSGLRRTRTTGGSSTTSGSTGADTCATPSGDGEPGARRRGPGGRADFSETGEAARGCPYAPSIASCDPFGRGALKPPRHAARTSLCGFARSSPPASEVLGAPTAGRLTSSVSQRTRRTPARAARSSVSLSPAISSA
jgi:hypothetical protein